MRRARPKRAPSPPIKVAIGTVLLALTVWIVGCGTSAETSPAPEETKAAHTKTSPAEQGLPPKKPS